MDRSELCANYPRCGDTTADYYVDGAYLGSECADAKRLTALVWIPRR